MQLILLAVLSFGCVPANGHRREGAGVTPIQKVIQMMQGMVAKGTDEKRKEQTQFAAYQQWCQDTESEKTTAIEKANLKIDVQNADIESLTNSAQALAKQIAGHQEDISVWQGDKKAATSVRAIDKKDFDALYKDLSESIYALDNAINVLKKQAYDRKQAGMSFAQISSSVAPELVALQKANIPDDARRSIAAFLAEGDAPSGLDVTAPEANAYEFQSGAVIDMLQKLLVKFTGERDEAEKKEEESIHAYNMLMQDLEDQISESTGDVEEKTVRRAGQLEKKATTEEDLKETTDVRDTDVAYLKDMQATCSQKASDFEARQQLRSEEIEALNKAIAIIQSEAVSGQAESLVQLAASKAGRARTSFAQLRSDMESTVVTRASHAELFLSSRAKALNSKLLASLASKIQADPFEKVKKMIKDLIVRLMNEATEEAQHKGWCDKELATNKVTRTEKSDMVDTLNAEIEELTASIATGTNEIAELTADLARIKSDVNTATELREKEKEENAQTVQDAEEAQAAVAQAKTVLRQFYENAAQATAFVQQKGRVEPPPEIFSGAYQGMQGSSGGVLGMMDVIESDFARLEAETKASEASNQKEYERFMSDSDVETSAKSTALKNKEGKKADEEKALGEKNADLEGTQKELDAALLYFDKLKPSCVDSGISYSDRVARRKEEIEALHEALKILNGDDLV